MRYIKLEEVFSCITGAVAIGQTTAGYTLEYSIDKEHWTQLQTVPANEDLLVPMINIGTFLRLKDNVDESVPVQN